MMRKIFSKRTFLIAGITYALVILAYFIGYFTHRGGGFLDFGPGFSGALSAAIATPFIIVGSIIFILICIFLKKQKMKNVLIGYLILTVGVGGVSIGTPLAIGRHQEVARIRQWQEITEQDIEFIENAMGDEVRRTYPNAEFYVDYRGSFGDVVHRHAIIMLGGFKYENQPDFDEEVIKWMEIAQSESFRDFPHRLSVGYYFENMQRAFAYIRLRDYSIFYTSLGMSEDGFAYLTPLLEDYLSNFHDDFDIWTDSRFRVTIHKELSVEDEANEEEMWRNFVELHDINTELVIIEATYRFADSSGRLHYHVRQNRWF